MAEVQMLPAVGPVVPVEAELRFRDGGSNNRITFYVASFKEALRLEANGDIYVWGRLVENDKEVVDGLRAFLAATLIR